MSRPDASSSTELELGRIRELSKRGRHHEALVAAQAFAATSPTNRDALYLIAANQRCLNQIAEALATLQRLEQHYPRFSLLYQERGHCYVALRNAPSAIESFRQAVNINPALSTSWLMLERLYRITGDAKNAARQDYVRVLIDRQKFAAAHKETEYLLSLDPDDSNNVLLHAAACAGLGEHEHAIPLYHQLLATSPESPELHLTLGHSLRAIGRQTEASESYRAAAMNRPGFGDAYWSLANLKSYRFSTEEIARMRREEAASSSRPIDRYHLCFALGKALEDRGEFADSWLFYERGNALKRAETHYDPEIVEKEARTQIEVCTAEFFAARRRVGVMAPDPILIVGLPRSGSTLIEQILASHSQVEGTRELADVQRIALDLPGALAELTPEDFRQFGERYMADTRAYRKGKPFFIDKMPNNFRHIALVHQMLPHATIIDVRREPMACCFSNLKQLFASGQEFTYSIDDIARYYRSYLELMRHWDAVLPGRVLRVWHEDVVGDLEGNVRRILEFCGLEFEPACLEFYKTERHVSSASSEQVRQPIFRDGLFQWRHYEAWLGPLKDRLGDALIRYRE